MVVDLQIHSGGREKEGEIKEREGERERERENRLHLGHGTVNSEVGAHVRSNLSVI